MDYRVVITEDAENDFEETKEILSKVASSMHLCTNPRLNKLGYRRINYRHHDYFMLYRIVDDMVIVDSIFHFLEDYENKMI